MQGFSVRLNKPTADSLRRIAENEGLAMGQLVRSILIKFVRAEEAKREDPK